MSTVGHQKLQSFSMYVCIDICLILQNVYLWFYRTKPMIINKIKHISIQTYILKDCNFWWPNALNELGIAMNQNHWVNYKVIIRATKGTINSLSTIKWSSSYHFWIKNTRWTQKWLNTFGHQILQSFSMYVCMDMC